jgi:hypothetical protein
MKAGAALLAFFGLVPWVAACPLGVTAAVIPPTPVPQMQVRPVPTPPVPAPAPRTSAKAGNAVDVYPVQPSAGSVPTGTTRTVGFWNYSGRPVVLIVGTQRVNLAARQSTQLNLPLTFTWNEAGQAERSETIPATAAGLEVVLRQ